MSWPFTKRQDPKLDTTTIDTLKSLQLIALEMEETKRKLAGLIEALKKNGNGSQ